MNEQTKEIEGAKTENEIWYIAIDKIQKITKRKKNKEILLSLSVGGQITTRRL